MEENISLTIVLKEEIDKLLELVQPLKSHGPNNKITSREELKVVGPVLGEIGLAGSPHYSLILITGFTQAPYVLPFTPMNVVKDLPKWILSIGKSTLIHKLLIIVEKIAFDNNTPEFNNIHLLIKWEDVSILEDKYSTQQGGINIQVNSFGMLSLQARHADKLDMCHIMVHHISLPFYNNQPPANCLVLISYADHRNLVSKLWLILKAEQVSWKEFIMPNREYHIEFPEGISKYYFDENKRPLREIFSVSSRELQTIFHHEKFYYSLQGAEIPAGSKIFLTNNTQLSKYNLQFKDDPLRHWYSVNEADNAASDLITLYGQVDSIMYDHDFFSKSCSLCTQAQAKRPVVSKSKGNGINSWTHPWQSQLELQDDEFILLPTACDDSNAVMKTGVPGNSVQILKVRDTVTDDVRTIYIKHSDSPNIQQLCRLAPGVVLVFSHLNRRQSSSGLYYYTPTVLSGCKILMYSPDQTSESWGLYGLVDCRSKIWGVLETISLSKVAITAKCSKCEALALAGACSSHCPAPYTFITSAHAIGWLLIFNGNTASQEKVIIKDNNVRKLLCIPEGIWQILLLAASEEEIVCFPNSQATNGNEDSHHMSEMLRLYCGIPKTDEKFYVSVKKMPVTSDGEVLYYCINLEPVNKHRLNIVANKVKETLLK